MAGKSGKIYLVGAGPGDPGLITLRGIHCLREADLVLYDYLANEHILDHVPPEATRVCLGRHGQGRLLSQHEVNEAMVTAPESIADDPYGEGWLFKLDVDAGEYALLTAAQYQDHIAG